MSELPTSPAPIELNSERIRTIERNVRFLTPVFGGGVQSSTFYGDNEASQQKPLDPVTPVRSASVRGHLRFWWRATTGAFCSSIEEMWEKEAYLWGTSAGNSKKDRHKRDLGKGRVGLTVDCREMKASDFDVFEIKPNKRGKETVDSINKKADIAYGAFTLKTEDATLRGGGPQAKLPGVLHDFGSDSFDVKLSAVGLTEEEVDSVTLALDAWLTLGGYGGRWRRGFGAVHSDDVKQARVLNQLLEKAGSEKVLDEVPYVMARSLQGGDATPRKFSTHEDAWRSALGAMRSFRQQRYNRDERRQSPMGKNAWPEPDALRALIKDGGRTDKPLVFPRAQLGLPIILHFPQEKARDFPNPQIMPADGGDRMPSPIITRPFADKSAVAILMGGARAPQVLIGKGGPIDDTKLWNATLNESQLAQLSRENLLELSQPDILLAFLDWFRTA